VSRLIDRDKIVPQRKVKVEIHVPGLTVLKVLGTMLLVYIAIALTQIIVILFLATMLAVTLHPMLLTFRRRGFPNWVGIGVVVGAILMGAALIFTLVLPPLFEQASLLMNNIPSIKASVLNHFPESGPFHGMVAHALQELERPDALKFAQPLVSVGQVAIGGLAQLFLVMIFTIYLLTDGPRTLAWILAFFAVERRTKLEATGKETSKVISAYVAGQAITSIICGVYSFIILTILDVPAALMLATIAGLFDVLPVLGFFLAAAPAVLLGMTISPFTGFLVAGFYVLYHAVENYFLIPKIYGNRLRLSDLVVLVSLLAAGTLGGIVAAIVILPLVASYPIIERIWLVNILGKAVVKKHLDAGTGYGSPKASEQSDRDSVGIPTYS